MPSPRKFPLLLAVLATSFVALPSGALAIGSPDLVLTLTDSPDPVDAGRAWLYEITVINAGDTAATNVVATDTLAPEVWQGSPTCSQGWASWQDKTKWCTFGTIQPGASATMQMYVEAYTGGTFSNTATATMTETDPTPQNNTQTVSTTVRGVADLSAYWRGPTPQAPQSEKQFVYEFSFSQAGPLDATNLVARVTVPDGEVARYVSFSSTLDCAYSAGEITCRKASAPRNYGYSVYVTMLALKRGSVAASATISSDTADGQTANNSASGTIDITEPTIDHWRSDSASSPAALSGAASAYDAEGNELLLFGGETSKAAFAPSDATQTWNGSNWQTRISASSPSARAWASASYQRTSRTVVLFGGRGASGVLGDTWTWDGLAWTQRTLSLAPPARSGAAMTSLGDRVVLFGGTGDQGAFDDTWIWDGTSWAQVSIAIAPSPRSGHVLIEDEVTGTLVLFGGCCGAGDAPVGDTWTFSGSAWTLRSPAASPAARTRAAGAFDRASAMPIVAGGADGVNATRSDVWAWDGRTWNARELTGTDPARTGATLAFAPNTGGSPNTWETPGRLVLFGGDDGDAIRSDTSTTRLAPQPRIRFSGATTMAFGPSLIGGQTAWRSITVTNDGTGRASGIQLVAPSALQSTVPVYSGCWSGIEARQSCTMQVTFRPATTAAITGAVAAVSNDPQNPYPAGVLPTIDVSGIGVLPSMAAPQIASTGSTNASFLVSWSTPRVVGVTYDVEYTERYRGPNGGWYEYPWKTWKSAFSGVSAWFGGAAQPASVQGRTYLFRARGRRGTEIGSWTSVKSTVVPLDERSTLIGYSTGWTSIAASGRYFGSLRYATAAGKTAQLRTDAAMFYIIAEKCPSCGAFDVYIDNVRVARVDTYATRSLWRQAVYSKWFAGGIRTHTIRVVTIGTPGRPSVRLDGIGYAR